MISFASLIVAVIAVSKEK
ncbi:hypothetical protein [Geobacillus jurassicus]|nr:hypothetical protein [Geobacillus jurassicus]